MDPGRREGDQVKVLGVCPEQDLVTVSREEATGQDHV